MDITPNAPPRPYVPPSRTAHKPLPSMAQFAINQQLHRTPPAARAEPLTNSQDPPVKLEQRLLESIAPANTSTNPLRSLSIYRDADSGKFVSIVRDIASGDVIEQIPEEEMLQFLSRMEYAQKHALQLPKSGSSLNMEA